MAALSQRLENDLFVYAHRRSFETRRTSALLMYSRSSGLAGCSSESRIRVMGETLSLWLSSLEANNKLWVRRWERLGRAICSLTKSPSQCDSSRLYLVGRMKIKILLTFNPSPKTQFKCRLVQFPRRGKGSKGSQ